MQVNQFLGFGFESNVYLLSGTKTALIDTGTGLYMGDLLASLEREIDIGDIEYIILTHEHFDHCGGVKTLKELSNARVCMHEYGAPVVEQGLEWSAGFFNARQPRADVEMKLKEGDVLDLGDISLHIIHTPGHSPGSICIYEPESKSLFSGDTVFAHGDVGRTDFFGGDVEALIHSVEKLARMDVENLYPGHGEYVLGEGSAHIARARRYLSPP